MSVAIYDEEELAGLWHALGGSDEVLQALGALAYANRAAYLLSYPWTPDELQDVMAFTLEQPAPYERAFTRDPLAWADNLLYNCVSNGGADFAPADRAEKLIAAAIAALTDDQRRTTYGALRDRYRQLAREFDDAVRGQDRDEALDYKRAQMAHTQKRMAALASVKA